MRYRSSRLKLKHRQPTQGAAQEQALGGSKQATLFAVSEGGPISLLFAATHPARVEALVLYETFVTYGGIPGQTVGWEPDAHKQFTDFMVE